MLLLRLFFKLKDLFQVKNGLTPSLLIFSEMLKIWASRTTLDRQKKEDGLGGKGSDSPNGGGEMVPISRRSRNI